MRDRTPGGGRYGGKPVPVGRRPLYVETLGEGRPILLLHGFGANSHTWVRWLTALSERGEVHLVDMRGFGWAPRPPGGDYAPETLAADVVDYLRSRELTDVVLVGHSLGGGVALLTALRLIDLGELRRLSGLVLVSAASLPQPLPVLMRLGRIPIAGSLGIGILPVRPLVRMVMRRIAFDPASVREDDVDAFARPYESKEAQAAIARALETIVPRDLERIAERYREIDTPSLGLWGAEDTIVPPGIGRELVERLGAARLALIPRCGHIPTLERPAASWAPVASFLDQIGRTTTSRSVG